MTLPIVLYDADCSLCRSLAELAARHAGGSLAFESWAAYRERQALGPDASGAEKLRVLDGEVLHEGEEAWLWLLERYEALSACRWLARKLGIERQTARALERGGATLRTVFCFRCKKRL